MIYLVIFDKEEVVNDVTGTPKPEVYASFQSWSFERTQRPQVPFLNEKRYENFKKKVIPISLDDFNQKTFSDNDIVIVPFLNRQRLNIEYRRITKQILKYLNPTNQSNLSILKF